MAIRCAHLSKRCALPLLICSQDHLEINLSQLINYEQLNEHIRNLLVTIEQQQELVNGLCRIQESMKRQGRALPGRAFGRIESFLVGPLAVNVIAKQSSVGGDEEMLLPPTAEEVSRFRLT